MKSDIEIKDDVFEHIEESGMMDELTGTLEKSGKRPVGSDKEDVIISIEAVDRAGDRQNVYVSVNIYIKDIARTQGDYVENGPRIREVCALAKQHLEVGGKGKDFLFHLEKQRVVEEENIHEHRIWNRLFYQITT